MYETYKSCVCRMLPLMAAFFKESYQFQNCLCETYKSVNNMIAENHPLWWLFKQR